MHFKSKKRVINKYNNYYKSYNDIKDTIEKRYNILIGIITIGVAVLLVGLFNVQMVRKDKYDIVLAEARENIIEGSTAPRGRIYDRNGKLLVDNKPVKVIYYKKPNKITTTREINLAYKVGSLIEVDYSRLTENSLRDFWIRDNKEKANLKITDEEWEQLNLRKLTASEIENLKKERITKEELDEYKDEDREAAYIYYLMNKGYSYLEKTIKNTDVTDDEYALIASSNIDGFNVRLDWERTYPYGNTLRAIFGSVSDSNVGIPSDLKEHYLKKGYSLDDRVGTSYLEYQYDDYLRGEKNKYKISPTNEAILVKEGKRGNDLVLTIDIELQQEVEKIVEEELVKAKKEANTKYFNKAFVVITNPKDGSILAMVGKQIIWKNSKNYEFLDFTTGVMTASITPGSMVKGASHITGYNNGGLKIGEVRSDTCVKLAATPIKCSWKNLGTINDITALQYSSNTYQFYTAMKVAKYNYYYNGAFKMKRDAFKIYRDTFAQFGLGVKTGIDLPNEFIGYKGTKDTPGLLLDYSIGQYDTYTPLQLAQYMATIAYSGKRMQLHLIDKIYSSEGESLKKEIYSYEPVLLNKVDTKDKYMKRVQEGFKKVISSGTGYNYINSKYKGAGKTGTSQTFIDTNKDGKIDTETLTNTFAGYAPYNDPEVVFVTLSPDVSDLKSGFTSSVNGRLAKRVSNKYFSLKK